jgi:hypothetical protein
VKRKAKRTTASRADWGTPERQKKGNLLPRIADLSGIVARRVRHECRLDWYLDKASLNDRQHAAGIRFRRDWQLAAADTKVIGTYGLRMPGGVDFREVQLAARQRVGKALLAAGREHGPVLVDVCGFDNWASGRLPLLRDGLTLLADHYGLPDARGSTPSV